MFFVELAQNFVLRFDRNTRLHRRRRFRRVFDRLFDRAESDGITAETRQLIAHFLRAFLRRRVEHEALCFEADRADAFLVTARRRKLHIAAVTVIESIGECW